MSHSRGCDAPSGGSFRRVCKAIPCPVCGKDDWCLVTPDGSAAICQRVEVGAVRRINEAGWLHRLKGAPRPEYRPREIVLPAAPAAPSRDDLPELAERFRADVRPGSLVALGRELGVSVASLERLQVGWSRESRAWSFPMRDAAGRVIGIRLRTDMGRKFSVKGGREGVFLPIDRAEAGPLLIVEGPTDLAAVLDLGFDAVGRPSCTGGKAILVELLKGRPPDEGGGIVVMSDNDPGGQGQRGALDLALHLRRRHRRVRIVSPPDRIKDSRAWIKAGATRAEFDAAIEAAPLVRMTISTQTKGDRHAN